MKKVKKIILILAIIVVLALIVLVCTNYVRATVDEIKQDTNPVVTMEIEGYGTNKIELYPDMAPNTVKNFVTLVNSGYYDGKTISEIGEDSIIGGFDLSDGEEESDSEEDSDSEEAEEVDEDTDTEDSEEDEEEEYVQGPKLSDIKTLGDSEEDSAYSIEGEFVEAGYTDNTLSHQRGVISMARESYLDYQYELYMMQYMGYSSYIDTLISLMDDSAGSGFFIMTENNIEYDGQYAAFGKVIEGMDVVDAIAAAECTSEDSEDEDTEDTDETATTPKEEIIITKVTVDTKGATYDAPETTSKIDFSSLFSSLLQSAYSD